MDKNETYNIEFDPYNKQTTSSLDQFLKNMLIRCEVTSYSELYRKLIDKSNGIKSIEKIFYQNPKYTPDKILTDILPINEIIAIKIYPKSLKTNLNYYGNKKSIQNKEKLKRKISFEKKTFLVSSKGLLSVIKDYRKKKYLPNDISLPEFIRIFGVRKEEEIKLKNMLNKIIETEKDQVDFELIIENTTKDSFDEKNEKFYQNLQQIKIHFKGLLEKPMKKKIIIQLLLVMGIFFVLMFFLINLVPGFL